VFRLRQGGPVTGGDSALFIAVFLACMVEAVEAATIVLAAGTAREWRSAWFGTAAAVAFLAAVVAALGPAVTAIPLSDLRLVVGGLLLIFGLQWLRKAILRASGYKALHDEDSIFAAELEVARAAAPDRRIGVSDWYAFTVSFKGVALEGLEVVFIVVTFGGNQHNLGLAAVAGAAAIVVVTGSVILIRAPLARVPENSMKFVVAVMLCSFGAFWSAQGAHAQWPGSDLALLVLIPAIAGLALALVAVLRWQRHRAERLTLMSPAAVDLPR
jgi:uncharacterized membrane protein